MDNNLPLHAAIATVNTENLNRLVHHSDVDINYEDNEGKTPLMANIEKDFSSIMAMSLIRVGSDVNCKRPYPFTLLHQAIVNNFIDVAQELILQGACIDVQSLFVDTPLSCAILHSNLEAVCLLLYYQADINTPIGIDETHLKRAFKVDDYSVCEVILDYCDDISYQSYSGSEAFTTAVRNQNPHAIALMKRGADVNTSTHYQKFPFSYAARHGDFELFKLIWSRLDYETLFHEPGFLYEYIDDSCFSNSEWLECFYLILNNPAASCLLKHCKDYESDFSEFNILWKSMFQFLIRGIEQNDRISFIYVYLSLDPEIIPDDLQLMHLLFGSNDEFEAVVYAGDLSYIDYKKQMRLLFKEPFKSTIPVVLYNLLSHDWYPTLSKRFFCSLGFCSMLPEIRKQCLAWIEVSMPKSRTIILEKLDTIPQFPSLLELSRDQVQKVIEVKFKIDKAYQFYDLVKMMKLPPIVADIILFKQPIY